MSRTWVVGVVSCDLGLGLGGALALLPTSTLETPVPPAQQDLEPPAQQPATAQSTPEPEADPASDRLPPLFAPRELATETGYALEFRGGQAVAVPTLRYDGTHPITLEAWVVPMAVRHSSVIANFQHAGLGLQIGQKGHWSFAFHDARQYRAAVSDSPVQPGRPVHLAGCFDGNGIALFVDGQLQGRTAECQGNHRASRFPFMIGADPNSSGAPEKRFNGVIDNVRISGTVRYAEPFRPPQRLDADEHTLGLWDFDTRGKLALDISANGNDGRIVGGENHVAAWIVPVYFDRYRRLRQLLIAARKTAGISQEQLAERMMRSNAFVAGYEARTQPMGVVDFLHVCDALAIDPGTILWQMAGPDDGQMEQDEATER